MTAQILVIDIERQAALIDEVWEGKQYNNWIGPDRTIEPSRTICFAYRWLHESRTKFVAEWDGGHPQDNTSVTPGGGHQTMIEKAHQLFEQADYVVGWNSKKFDVRHLKAAMFAYGMKPPAPHVDIDLMLQGDREFLFPAKSLAYVTKIKGHAGKLKLEHGLRRKLRYADGDILLRAQRSMKRYNIRDVNETLAVYHDMRPWLQGMNVGLMNIDGLLHCPNCNSTNHQSRGTAKRLTYVYKRRQCNDCGKWFKDTRSFAKTTVVGM